MIVNPPNVTVLPKMVIGILLHADFRVGTGVWFHGYENESATRAAFNLYTTSAFFGAARDLEPLLRC